MPTVLPRAVISCTLGCSSTFDVNQYVEDGDTGQPYPKDFAPGEVALMVIGLDPPVRVTASLSANVARFTIPADVCDQLRTGAKWHVVLAGVPYCTGVFQRYDG